MRVIVLALLLIAIFVIVSAVVLKFRAAVARHKKRKSKWIREEKTYGGIVSIVAELEGQSHHELLCSIRLDDPEFEYKIEEYRAKADQTIAAMNSGRRLI